VPFPELKFGVSQMANLFFKRYLVYKKLSNL
jgi:hypothetical protein